MGNRRKTVIYSVITLAALTLVLAPVFRGGWLGSSHAGLSHQSCPPV